MPQDKGKGVESGRMTYDVSGMLTQKIKNRHSVAAGILLAAMAIGVGLQAANAKITSNLVEHKAFYEMQMGERQKNSHKWRFCIRHRARLHRLAVD